MSKQYVYNYYPEDASYYTMRNIIIADMQIMLKRLKAQFTKNCILVVRKSMDDVGEKEQEYIVDVFDDLIQANNHINTEYYTNTSAIEVYQFDLDKGSYINIVNKKYKENQYYRDKNTVEQKLSNTFENISVKLYNLILGSKIVFHV